MISFGGLVLLKILVYVVFVCFVIYFVFKMLGFIFRAIALYEKMINRQDDMIKLLIQIRDAVSGDQPNQADPDAVAMLQKIQAMAGTSGERTSLRDAAARGDVALLQLFVDAGADVNEELHHESPLDLAIEGGHFDAVKFLVERGARIKHNAIGISQIRRAKYLKHLDISNYLTEKS
jgi:ankyrin repeat protein